MAVRSDIDVEKIGDATVVALGGDADYESSEPLRRVLTRIVSEDDGAVVVDLRDAAFMDSSGIAALLNARRRLTRQGRRMAVIADGPAIVRPLELAHLSETLNLRASLREALACVGA